MKRKRFLRYSFLLSGLAFLKTGPVAALYKQSRQLFLNKVKFIWSGSLGTTTVKVHAKLSTATTSARLVVSTDAGLSNPVYGAFQTADASNNYIAKLTVSGLAPATTYYYGIEADGVVDTAADAIGRFKTFNAGPQSFRFSIASCNNNGDHPVFYRIKEKDPLFHITHGDFHYADPNSATDRTVHQTPFETTLGKAAMKEFLRNHGIAYMWDDHDYCGDNTNSTAVGRTNARFTYQEYVPHYPLAAGSGDVPIYQSFTVGRIRFILSDLRSEKGAAGTSIMGAAQKQWFKNECTAAKNNNQPIIWISSVPWGGTVDQDTWAGFTAERTELSDFFKSLGIQNLLIICGDAHMIAYDDGTNHDFSTGGNPFKYPVLQAAAVNQTGSFRGGDFTHGYFSNPTQQHGQYAALDITDNGGSNITVNITGYRVDSTGLELILLTTSINFAVLSVLPIKISGFTVAEAPEKGKTLLQWKTEFGANDQCKKMVVERSSDGAQFLPIGSVDCNTTLVNTGQHSFVDASPLNGKNFYRIKITDQQGNAVYSRIEHISFHKGLSLTIHKNPVDNQLQLSISTNEKTTADYLVVDADERTVLSKPVYLNAGQNNVAIEVHGLASGIYFFTLRTKNSTLTKRFVKK